MVCQGHQAKFFYNYIVWISASENIQFHVPFILVLFQYGEANWTESPIHEYNAITASYKHTEHSSIRVRVAYS